MIKSSQFAFQGLATAVLVLSSLWIGTQWTAAALKFHPALGAPWISLFGWPVYAPWQLFAWWLAFGRLAPRVFDMAGLIAAAGGVLAGLVAIGGAAWRASKPKVVTTYGSARWATVSDIRLAGLCEERGVMLGQSGNSYLRDDGPHHVLAVAPTRSGKGVGLVVPTLLSWTGSAIIHDIKGENWQRRQVGVGASRTASSSTRPTLAQPASIHCSRFARGRTRSGTCRTSPTS